MKALIWIATALLMTMLAYGLVEERHNACDVPQLSQVLK